MNLQNGREDQKENDLFFTCSLIDYIARKTKNTRQSDSDDISGTNDQPQPGNEDRAPDRRSHDPPSGT